MSRLLAVVALVLVAAAVRADSAGDLVDQANAAMKNGDPAAALKFADQAIAADPKLGIAYELRDGSGIGVGAPQFGQRRGFYGTVAYDF